MGMDSPIYLRAAHLAKSIQSGDALINVLRDVNLSIIAGESIAILGASGSGKTTLLTLLAGLDVATAGEIEYGCNVITRMSEEQRATFRRHHVGFIFQAFQLLPSLTALENVMLPLEIQNESYYSAKEKSMAWLDKVGLSHRVNHYPNQLSGGEQQRVAIARAFVINPKIIFADEITGNLDSETGKKIIDILFSINKDMKTTLVLVTHDSNLADLCDRKYTLSEGVLHLC